MFGFLKRNNKKTRLNNRWKIIVREFGHQVFQWNSNQQSNTRLDLLFFFSIILSRLDSHTRHSKVSFIDYSVLFWKLRMPSVERLCINWRKGRIFQIQFGVIISVWILLVGGKDSFHTFSHIFFNNLILVCAFVLISLSLSLSLSPIVCSHHFVYHTK